MRPLRSESSANKRHLSTKNGSGTPEFAELVTATLGDNVAVIWGNHGAMVVGVTLAMTFSAAHALEDNAQVYTIARQIGIPRFLAPE